MTETQWLKHKRVFIGSRKKSPGLCWPQVHLDLGATTESFSPVSLFLSSVPHGLAPFPRGGRRLRNRAGLPLPSHDLCWRRRALLWAPLSFNCIPLAQIGCLWTNPCGQRGGSALIGGLVAHPLPYLGAGRGGTKGLHGGWFFKESRV